jgi:hypothetical protein
MKTVTHSLKGLCFVAALAFAGAATAEESPAPASAPAASANSAEVLSSDDLEALSGGTGVEVIVDTDQVLTATNSGNSVNGDVVGSGQVNIGSNAFSGYDGIGNFVINTGHNNNLQSSMNVNVVLTPPETPGP